MPAAAQIAHGSARSEQTLHCNRAKRHQDVWLNNLDLFHEIRAASLHLRRGRWAVAKTARRCVRSTLKNVRDINVFACEIHRFQNFRKQLSGAPHERFAQLVFVRAWRFTDEHQVGVRISYTENSLRARAGEVSAFRANANALADRLE